MKRTFQKHFNKITMMVALVGVLAMPFSVHATTPIPQMELSDEGDQVDRTSELEHIREEREVNREEGVASGEKLVIEEEQTVEGILSGGPLSNEQKADIIGRICQKGYQTSGILASVTAAQCILKESDQKSL